jgi:hypothetical protein
VWAVEDAVVQEKKVAPLEESTVEGDFITCAGDDSLAQSKDRLHQ